MPGRLPRARGLHVKLRLHRRLLKRQASNLRRLSQTGRRAKFGCFWTEKDPASRKSMYGTIGYGALCSIGVRPQESRASCVTCTGNSLAMRRCESSAVRFSSCALKGMTLWLSAHTSGTTISSTIGPHHAARKEYAARYPTRLCVGLVHGQSSFGTTERS